ALFSFFALSPLFGCFFCSGRLSGFFLLALFGFCFLTSLFLGFQAFLFRFFTVFFFSLLTRFFVTCSACFFSVFRRLFRCQTLLLCFLFFQRSAVHFSTLFAHFHCDSFILPRSSRSAQRACFPTA